MYPQAQIPIMHQRPAPVQLEAELNVYFHITVTVNWGGAAMKLYTVRTHDATGTGLSVSFRSVAHMRPKE